MLAGAQFNAANQVANFGNNTIDAHSSGQPSTKISATMTISSIVGGSDRLVSRLARYCALPRREKTEPNRLETAT